MKRPRRPRFDLVAMPRNTLVSTVCALRGLLVAFQVTWLICLAVVMTNASVKLGTFHLVYSLACVTLVVVESKRQRRIMTYVLAVGSGLFAMITGVAVDAIAVTPADTSYVLWLYGASSAWLLWLWLGCLGVGSRALSELDVVQLGELKLWIEWYSEVSDYVQRVKEQGGKVVFREYQLLDTYADQMHRYDLAMAQYRLQVAAEQNVYGENS